MSGPRVTRQVVDAIRTGERRRLYELHAWVVMPNHVHMLLLERTGSMSLGITGER
jgi:REP element-mobilizing transposase RayT